jgi:hypothetical protein
MSHTFTVAPLSVRVWGNRCATLEQEMLSLAGSVDGQYLCSEQDERYTQARIDTRPHSPVQSRAYGNNGSAARVYSLIQEA